MTNSKTDEFIDIYNSNIFNIYDDTTQNSLLSIKINFKTEKDYDIFINDEKHSKRYHNCILLLTDIYRKYKIKKTDIFHVKTNCNYALSLNNNLDYDVIAYNLFDDYINSIDNCCILEFSKKKIKLQSVYLHIYFYKIRIDYFIDCTFNELEDKNIYIGRKQSQNFNYEISYYIDFIKYILINTSTKFKSEYNFVDNKIITFQLYEYNTLKIPFDIICSINILETYDNNISLIITPIKIIDNSTQYIINIYNNSCENCKLKNKNFNIKYYSKSILICDKHNKQLENNIIDIFKINIDYYITKDNIITILNREFNLSIDNKIGIHTYM
jgi:hypothetical protein